MKSAYAPLFILLIAGLLLPQPLVAAEEPYAVRGVVLTVFRDGVVHVKLEVSVNETEPLITLPLLSDRVYNVLAVDELGEPLDYDLEGANITIYTLGTCALAIGYDTDALTSKEAGVWTLQFATPFKLTVELPENSTILFLSGAPDAITSEGGRLKLELSPGVWEISYEMPMAPSPVPSPAPQPKQTLELPLATIIAIAVGVVAAVLAALLLVKRRRTAGQLRAEEAEVLRFLKERGGRALEAELREAFPIIPKTSMWRLLRRLEKRGAVKIRKVGLQNVVELA